MSLKADFELLARYTQWMNARLYAQAAALDETELQADRGAFFGSILATLAHIHAADVHWMKRFAVALPQMASLDAVRARPLPELVRGISFPDFARLRSEREAMDAVMVYEWPGNVRELENALEHAGVLTRSSLIDVASLPERITRRRKEPLVAERSYLNPTLDVIERAYIMWVLQVEGGNKTRAAEVLGIDPSTLYRKLSRYEEQVAEAAARA